MSRVKASERPSERPSIREAIKRPSKGHPASFREAIHQRGHQRGHQKASSEQQQAAASRCAAGSNKLDSGVEMSTLAVDRDALRDALIERLVVANTILVLEART